MSDYWIKTGEMFSSSSYQQEWQLDSADDINNPPSEANKSAPGSMAWTGDYSHIYNKQNDGTWVDIIGE